MLIAVVRKVMVTTNGTVMGMVIAVIMVTVMVVVKRVSGDDWLDGVPRDVESDRRC